MRHNRSASFLTLHNYCVNIDTITRLCVNHVIFSGLSHYYSRAPTVMCVVSHVREVVSHVRGIVSHVRGVVSHARGWKKHQLSDSIFFVRNSVAALRTFYCEFIIIVTPLAQFYRHGHSPCILKDREELSFGLFQWICLFQSYAYLIFLLALVYFYFFNTDNEYFYSFTNLYSQIT